MRPFSDLARLSLNQMTTERWSVREAVEGCARAGIPAIGLWRNKVAEAGLQESARLVRDAGLRVSSLCRGGMFPAATPTERGARIEDNRRAIDEAAEIGTDVLVLVCGAARMMVAEGIAELVPYARERGVRLGIEPLHPMFAADRSVIVTLGQAGGGEQLRVLYQRAGRDAKRPIIIGLFNARAEDELIRIADQEKDPQLREEALLRLRLLGTPKARAYIQKAGRIR